MKHWDAVDPERPGVFFFSVMGSEEGRGIFATFDLNGGICYYKSGRTRYGGAINKYGVTNCL